MSGVGTMNRAGVSVKSVIVLVLSLFWGHPAWTQEGSPREIRHYQKNVLIGRHYTDQLFADVIRFRPDTISLQEVSIQQKDILEKFDDEYPYQHYCMVRNLSGVAVLSRWPVVEGTQRCFDGWGFAGFQVEMPEGRVWVLSAHIEDILEGRRVSVMLSLLPKLGELRGPMIIGGDFNAEPTWLSTQLVASTTGTKIIGRAVPTFMLYDRIPIAIDHILATGGTGIIMQRPKLGSDHFGVVASFRMEFE